MLCQGLKLSIPQKVSSVNIKVSFGKAYWKLEPTVPDDLKEPTAATVPSIALSYTQHRSPKPPKALLRAISSSKRHNGIVITKVD